ncbi:hypothetical protein GGR53DRAFT_484538 [Hypoxylon sp. FL1150]|nr:hypothetical protein GGR53DRAFT_484538 [Hypoxylon sp. FL1150]
MPSSRRREGPTAVVNPTHTLMRGGFSTARLLEDPVIGFKIRLLVFDFAHYTTRDESRWRANQIHDPVRPDGVHFTDEEAVRVWEAYVSTYAEVGEFPEEAIPATPHQSVAQMLGERVTRHWEKRLPDGGRRPIEAGEVALVYASVFGISRAQMDDPAFAARVARYDVQERMRILGIPVRPRTRRRTAHRE